MTAYLALAGFLSVCGVWLVGFVGVRLPSTTGSIGWVLDTLGQWQSQQLWLIGCAALVLLVQRRFRKRSIAAVVGSCVLIATLGTFAPAALSGRPAWLPAEAVDSDVRVLVFNAKSVNTDVAAIEAVIDASGADIAVLCELNARFVRKYYTQGRGELSHVQVRAPIPGVSAWTLVMSRWPMQRLPGTESEPVVSVLVAAPTPFELVGIHLPSPRTADRWAHGAELASSLRGTSGLPLVIAGDLNASPVGGRERLMSRSAGVVRSKPVLNWAGTFPALGWGPTRLAIDGVWTDRSFEARSWQVGPSAGSDHRSLVVGLGFRSGVDRDAAGVDTGGADAVGAASQ